MDTLQMKRETPFPDEIPEDAPGEETEPPEEFERIDEVREPPYPDGRPS